MPLAMTQSDEMVILAKHGHSSNKVHTQRGAFLALKG